jgi:hypothetical protein
MGGGVWVGEFGVGWLGGMGVEWDVDESDVVDELIETGLRGCGCDVVEMRCDGDAWLTRIGGGLGPIIGLSLSSLRNLARDLFTFFICSLNFIL